MIIKLKKSKLLESGEFEREDIICTIDTSLYAHLKFEEKFSNLNTNLNTYASRFLNSELTEDYILCNFLSIMKVIYCFINTDKIECFSDFIKLFNIADGESLSQNINSIKTAFDNIKSTVVPEKK